MATNDITRASEVIKKYAGQLVALAAKVEYMEENGVDLTGYSTTEQMNAAINGAVSAGVAEAKSYADEEVSLAETSAKTYTDNAIAKLVGESPEELDTIFELVQAIQSGDSAVQAIVSQLADKADLAALNSHINDSVKHVTAVERTTWNEKATTEYVDAGTTIQDETLRAWIVSEAGV